jgi:hypothetical protein
MILPPSYCVQHTGTGASILRLFHLQQVLDAPALQDDFYLNLVDWSAQNVLAVGLGAQAAGTLICCLLLMQQLLSPF